MRSLRLGAAVVMVASALAAPFPAAAQVPAGAMANSGTFQVAFVEWRERDRSSVRFFSGALFRMVSTRTWFSPLHEYAGFSATIGRCRRDDGKLRDCRFRGRMARRIPHEEFDFDLLLESAGARFGRGRHRVDVRWRGTGDRELEPFRHVRSSGRITDESLWTAGGGQAGAWVARTAEVSGRLFGRDLTDMKATGYMLEGGGGAGFVGACLIDSGSVCD